MKNIILICSILLSLVLYPFVNVNSNANIPPAKTTGAPGETTCAQGAGCHGSSTVDADSQLALDLGGMTLYDGSTTTVTISIVDPNSSKFGFELTALDENNMKAGTFIATEANTFVVTNSVQGSDREYISHFGSTATSSWTFDWESPSSDVGDVTFYVVGNAANNDSGPDEGDVIYTKTFSLSAGATSIETQEFNKINFYPNPSQDVLYINDLEGFSSVTVSDWSGKTIINQSIDSDQIELITSELPEGIYILSVHSENKIWNDKFVVNR